MHSRGRAESGQALVELAISSVALILLLFGVTDFARLYNAQTALEAAAREGARFGAQYDGSSNSNPNLVDASIKGIVDSVLQGAGLPATSSVSDQCFNSSPHNGVPDANFSNSAFDPVLFICYDASGNSASVPNSNCQTTCGGFDMVVQVAMRYGLVITGIVGPNVEQVGYAHMRVQGS